MKQSNAPWYILLILFLVAFLTFLIGAADKKSEAAAAETSRETPQTVSAEDAGGSGRQPVAADGSGWQAEPTYTAEDLYVMAHLLAGECQGSSWKMQLYVGSVVLNRVRSSHYPNTIKGVVFDRRHGTQYQCTRDGNYDREPTKRNWAAAKYLLTNGSQLPTGVLHQSQKRLGPLYEKVGNQYFCYE